MGNNAEKERSRRHEAKGNFRLQCFRLARERARIVREEHALQNTDDMPKELDRHEETMSEQKPPT